MDDTRDKVDRGPSRHGLHLPTLADPMVLLDELERRLDQCETVVSGHLEQIQRRLDALEGDVRSILADIGGGPRSGRAGSGQPCRTYLAPGRGIGLTVFVRSQEIVI